MSIETLKYLNNQISVQFMILDSVLQPNFVALAYLGRPMHMTYTAHHIMSVYIIIKYPQIIW